MPQLGVNARVGSGRYVVAEADESDGSLARLRPRAAVVLNAELDHHDHFDSLDDLHALFARLGRRAAAGRRARPARVARLPPAAELRRYGAGPGEGWRALDVAPDGEGMRFVLAAPGRDRLALRIGVPGAHNALNATAALALLDWAGIGPERAAAPLAAFRGAGRRYERRGEVAGIRFVDDYAHHPRSSRRRSPRPAARPRPDACWRASSRTCRGGRSMFADDFATALLAADAACVCDVYVARGAPDPAVTGELIVASALRQRPGFPIAWTPGYDDAADWIATHRAARRSRAHARRRARRLGARARARAARMTAPPPRWRRTRGSRG